MSAYMNFLKEKKDTPKTPKNFFDTFGRVEGNIENKSLLTAAL